MEIYFLRHGLALPHSSPGFSEESRPLSSEGVQKMILVARGMKRLGLSFDETFSSPLPRAFQTAEIVREYLPLKGGIKTENSLLPGGTLKNFFHKIRVDEDQKILLVGHEPSMSLWIQALLGVEGEGRVLLKKGGLCHLRLAKQMNPFSAELVALYPPRSLRQLGK